MGSVDDGWEKEDDECQALNDVDAVLTRCGGCVLGDGVVWAARAEPEMNAG